MNEHLESDVSRTVSAPVSEADGHGSAGSAQDSPHDDHCQSTGAAEPKRHGVDEKTAGQFLDEITTQRRALLDRLASR